MKSAISRGVTSFWIESVPSATETRGPTLLWRENRDSHLISPKGKFHRNQRGSAAKWGDCTRLSRSDHLYHGLLSRRCANRQAEAVQGCLDVLLHHPRGV